MVSKMLLHHHDSPIITTRDEKTIQVVGDLIGDPLDSRKTRSQFHNSFSTCDLNIPNRFFMMVGFDTKTYQEESLDPIWKKTMQ